jgi:hypothetical protein
MHVPQMSSRYNLPLMSATSITMDDKLPATTMELMVKDETHLEYVNAEPELTLLKNDKERRLVRKQDLIIIPSLWLMFFVGYLVQTLVDLVISA